MTIPDLYTIKDWDKHFETAKTREYQHCQRITFETNLHKPAVRALLGEPDGWTYFGIWVGLCEWYGSTYTPKRDGKLVQSHSDLTPLTVGVIADCIGASEKQVQSALKRLSEPDIGWISVEVGVQSDDSPPLVATRARSLHSTPLHSTPLQSKEDKSTANEICRMPPTEITGNSYYLTAKKKKLHGNTLLSFIDFCKAFGYMRGTREAADSWLNVYQPDIVNDIIAGAKRECKGRADLRRNGNTPKMMQGWLTGHRWEDDPPSASETLEEQGRRLRGTP